MQPQNRPYFLGVNLGYAVNRYPEPHDWVETVKTIGIKRIQFVADLLNPVLPQSIRERKIAQIKELCSSNNLAIESAFTGAFTRVNHFGSEDEELREYWLKWFLEYAKQMSQLGVTSIGGHPGILSLKNDSDSDLRRKRMLNISEYWVRLFARIEHLGISTILWEPMSISREIGHTISDALFFQELLESQGGNSFKICLDLDHGDLESKCASDRNPIEWIRKFGDRIGSLHLKQTMPDRRRHMSFTPENNMKGTVVASEILSALEASSVNSLTMYLELGFKERNPDDRNAVLENALSVNYWKEAGARIN
jgi:sugar phosphate isomerase/epimerase